MHGYMVIAFEFRPCQDNEFYLYFTLFFRIHLQTYIYIKRMCNESQGWFCEYLWNNIFLTAYIEKYWWNRHLNLQISEQYGHLVKCLFGGLTPLILPQRLLIPDPLEHEKTYVTLVQIFAKIIGFRSVHISIRDSGTR